jgi:23S rRNA pseudouridine2604 synthase
MNTSTDPVRLSKLMSERGICSRREADEFIERGWVLVDGKAVTTLGTKIQPHQKIELSPEARKEQNQLVTILLNKPIGYVSGQPELGYDPAAILIRPETQDPQYEGPRLKPQNELNLAPAGRLDIDSQGLLVFTQDGRLAKHLIGQDSNIEKEYLVRVSGRLTDAQLSKLRFGLELDGKPLKPANVDWINADQLRFILREGRKRQIRRMCELVGLEVRGLKRVRIGQVKLGKLQEGHWRFLGTNEKF